MSLIRRNQAFYIQLMNTFATQPGDAEKIHRERSLFATTSHVTILLIFVGMSLFPAQALAFLNDVELAQLTLVFSYDQDINDLGIVGIETFLGRKTVGDALSSGSLEVRSTLTKGSVVRVLSMAYSSTPGQTDASPEITASGEKVRSGTLAANFLPFGTKVRIGNKIYTVTDRMNSRYDGKYVIDIWKPSKFEAMEYGARIIKIKVVSIPKPQSEGEFQIIDSLRSYLPH